MARSEIARELRKARDELADLKVSTKAVTCKRDQLLEEVTVLKKERDEGRVTIMESKIDQECKDEYIDHLAFLLKPHLGPSDVVDKIYRIPEEIGVNVTHNNHRAPKNVSTTIGEATLFVADP